MMFKGIIFDFNGVLWWDKELQEDSWNRFANSFRGYAFTQEEQEVHVHGRNMAYTLTYLAGHPLNQGEVEDLTEQKEKVYRQLCLEQGTGFRLSPGAESLLDFLRQHEISRTIATASGIVNLNFFLQHLSLERWFKLEQIIYDDGTTPGKPAPDFYQLAAQNLDLGVEQCVVVEDSLSGIQAAHVAGIGHIIALAPAGRHAEIATFEGADSVVEDLSEIPKEKLFLD